MLAFISLLFCALCCSAASGGSTLSVKPHPSDGEPEMLLDSNSSHDLSFPAFSEKAVIEIAPDRPAFLQQVILTANAAPSANFVNALVEVKNGGDWRTADLLQSPSGHERKLYRMESKLLNLRAERVRITLTPPFIESAMTLRAVQLKFAENAGQTAPTAGESAFRGKLRGGGIVLGGQKRPGYLSRFVAPGINDGEKLAVTAGFLLPDGQDFESSLLVQKENVATCLQIVLRGKEGKREIGYRTPAGYQTLFPLSAAESQVQVSLECNNATRRFTLTLAGKRSAEIPFNTALPAIDTIFFSVPAASVPVQLNLLRYELTGKSGKRATGAADFSDPAEFSRFKHSGQVHRVEPETEAVRPAAGDLLEVRIHGKQYAFSRRNGELFGIRNAESGRLLVDSLRSVYSLQSKEHDSDADGLQDRVIEVKQGKGTLRFRCTAAFDPSVEIEKIYTFTPKALSKHLRFHSPQGKFRFITSAERLVFPRERCDKLILVGGDPWFGPRVRLSEVKLPARQLGSGTSHSVAAFEPQGKDSIALLRYLVNDRFTWPVHTAYTYEAGNALVYHPDGITLPVATLPLHEDEVSCEIKLLFFDGSEMEYIAAYRALPEVAKAYAEIKRPAWMADVIVQLWLRSDLTGEAARQLKQLLSMTERGDIMVILNQPFIWGDFGEKPLFRNIWGAWTHDTEYIELIRELKALSPRVKVALYTWLWTIAPDSDFNREFPNAVIARNRNGRIFNSYPGVELSYQRRMSDPAGLKQLAMQYETMMRKYGVDFCYLDGGSGGAPVIDWEHGTVDQDYQWQDFYRYMRDLSERYGKGGVSFNFKSNPIADNGIAEMGLDSFRNNPALVASRIWGAKLQEKNDPEHRITPCYWGMSDPWYTDICLGFGLLPHIECAGLSRTEANFITRKSPFLGAMREMFRITPVRILPGSMLDASPTGVLGFEFTRDFETLYSLIPVEKAQKSFQLPASRTFLWKNDLVDPSGFQEIFTEAQQMEAWKSHFWRLSRTMRHRFLNGKNTIPLQEKLLTVVSSSDSGAVILATDGLPTQMRLSTLPGISVTTQYHEGNISGHVVSNGETLEIALALPPGRKIHESTNAELRGFFHDNGCAFAVLRLNGDFDVTLAPAEKRDFTVPFLERTSPGQTVRLAGKPDGAAISLYLDSQLVMTTMDSEFTVPALARNGHYELKVEDSSGILGSAVLEIAGEQPIPLPQIPNVVRSKAAITKVAEGPIRAIALGGGQDEAADPHNLVLTAKIKERPESVYNYSAAGFAFSNVRFLRFLASSDIATRYCIERRKSWGTAFAGILVDYEVDGQFVKRVAFDLGMGTYSFKKPEYGTGRIPDEQVKFGTWIQNEAQKKLSLDLARYSPKGWKGECIVSAVVANVLQGRKLELKLEAFSADDKSVLVGGTAEQATAVLTESSAPDPVSLPCEIRDFREHVTLKPAVPATSLAIRGDGSLLYFTFICSEPDFSSIIARTGVVHEADSVELHFYDPVSQKLTRVAANAAGDLDAGALENVKVSAEKDPLKKEFRIKFVIPRSQLPPGNELRINACRNRPRRYEDPAGMWTNACWSRLKKEPYATPKFFGIVRIEP